MESRGKERPVEEGPQERTHQAAGLCECGCGGAPPLATVNRRNRGLVKGQPQRFILGHQHKVRSRKHLPYRNNRSGVHGVWWDDTNKKWAAQLQIDGRRVALGQHDNLGAAERAVQTCLRTVNASAR